MTDDEVKSWRELSFTKELYRRAFLNFQAACEALDAKLCDLQEKYDQAVSDKAELERSLDAARTDNDGMAWKIDDTEKLPAMVEKLLDCSFERESLLLIDRDALKGRLAEAEKLLGNSIERERILLIQNGTLIQEFSSQELLISELRATLACRESALKSAAADHQQCHRGAQFVTSHEPAPAKSAKEPVLPFVNVRLGQRAGEGAVKHGGPLCLFNGRDACNDATEEVLDAVQYLVQTQTEQKLLASRDGYAEDGVRVRLHNQRLTFHVDADRLHHRRFVDATGTTVKDLILKAGGYNIENMHDYFFVSVGPEVNIAKFVRTVLDALRES